MLDVRILREEPDRVRKNLARRGLGAELVEAIVSADTAWRSTRLELDRLRAERNKAALEVARLKKDRKDAAPLTESMREIGAQIERLEAESLGSETRRDELLWKLPNLIHESVPAGKDSSENQVVATWGKAKKHAFTAKSHVDLLERLDIADMERAARAAGARFFFLKNEGVLLNQALQQYALERLRAKGFVLIDPPYLLRREAVAGAVDLADFGEVIYKVEGEDLHLIATSEHALATLHWDEILEEKRLPLRYAGVSPCFRKEAGAHGKDTKGIFRVHQFHKVEQFIFAAPENSWPLHEELRANSEELLRGLEIPYRVVNICTGDLGTVAAKKYDLEAWMPVQDTYREVVSCSHCTDYQARRYKIRTRAATDQPTRTVHTLNATGLASERTIVAILENFQDERGQVKVPKALHRYMDGVTVLEPKR